MMTPARYRDFWADVGEQFPDLSGAASTRYYADNEQRLFNEHFGPLHGLSILKTDLWDEARNTRILVWARSQGARAFGIDISPPDAEAGAGRLCRRAGFARVLRPGGRAIVGVPNRLDPFLRPLLATVLQSVGAYGYSYEKSYTRRALREMLERAGLEVVAETAILFIPGWLRMLDLACHAWCRPLAAVTGALVAPFVLLDRHVPAVRRHGCLLATVVRKPGGP